MLTLPVLLVDYTSGEVPVQVHTEAFNPCIPLDSKNSGIPVIIFNFTVTNKNSNTARVKQTLEQSPSDTAQSHILSTGFSPWIAAEFCWMGWSLKHPK